VNSITFASHIDLLLFIPKKIFGGLEIRSFLATYHYSHREWFED
jgi:hypothetical protein